MASARRARRVLARRVWRGGGPGGGAAPPAAGEARDAKQDEHDRPGVAERIGGGATHLGDAHEGEDGAGDERPDAGLRQAEDGAGGPDAEEAEAGPPGAPNAR